MNHDYRGVIESTAMPTAEAHATVPGPGYSTTTPMVNERVPGLTVHDTHTRTQVRLELRQFAGLQPKILRNPDRIYFDLGPDVFPVEFPMRSVLPLNDRLVRRIRIGRKTNGMTRVVLDLQKPCRFTYRISPSPPYLLSITVQ